MEKVKELLKRLTEEFEPPNGGEHSIVLEGDSLMLYVFYKDRWFSGILTEPIDVEKDVEDFRNHIKEMTND